MAQSRQAQGKANPDAPDVDAEQAEAGPPADHAADPEPEPAAAPEPGGDTTAGPVTAQGGQVRGGRLADLAQPSAMPEGVPYAIAREPLFIVNPEAAAAPVRAFNAGDRVPAELVEKFGWHSLTDLPEWATAPPAPAPDSEGAE
jgi:hypothetical protein